MLEIKVTVEIPGLPEAIHALAGAVAGNCATVQNPPEKPVAFVRTNPGQMANIPPSGVIAAPAPTENPTSGHAVTAMPTMTEPPVNAPAETVPSVPAPTNSKPVTLDDLGRAGAALIDQNKMPQLIALLAKYGVQAVTQLKPEAFEPFAAELRALGAKF